MTDNGRVSLCGDDSDLELVVKTAKPCENT